MAGQAQACEAIAACKGRGMTKSRGRQAGRDVGRWGVHWAPDRECNKTHSALPMWYTHLDAWACTACWSSVAFERPNEHVHLHVHIHVPASVWWSRAYISTASVWWSRTYMPNYMYTLMYLRVGGGAVHTCPSTCTHSCTCECVVEPCIHAHLLVHFHVPASVWWSRTYVSIYMYTFMYLRVCG